MDIQVFTDEAALERVVLPWRGLQERLGLAPFTGYDFFSAWWRTIGKAEGQGLYVVAGFDDGRLVGILPLAISRKHGIRVMRLAGHDAFYYRSFLIEPAFVGPIWAAARACPFYDVADIKNIHAGTPEHGLLETFGWLVEKGPVYHREHPGASRASLLAPYSKRFRRNMARVAELLAADPSMDYGQTRAPPLPEDAVPFLVRRKAEWCREKGKSGVFDNPRVGDFYAAMIGAALDNGQLALHWIRQNGRIRALVVGFVCRDTVYGHLLAFEHDVARLTPGLFLNAEMMIWAAENGLRETNFMEGREEFKTRMATAVRVIHEYMFARTWKGWAFMGAYLLRHRVRAWKRARAERLNPHITEKAKTLAAEAE